MAKADRLTLTLALALLFSMLSLSIEGFAGQCDTVRGETLRLHIVAASDSDDDQKNKLLVRDAVLEQYSALLSGKTAEQAAHFAAFLSGDIRVTAQKALREAGCGDEVAVSVAEMYFDTRSYQDGVTLPAGNYTALRIVIGEGAGQNWWCVLYPPLCIPACSPGLSEKAEKDIRSLELQPAYKAKFAVIELAQKLLEITGGAKPQ